MSYTHEILNLKLSNNNEKFQVQIVSVENYHIDKLTEFNRVENHVW